MVVVFVGRMSDIDYDDDLEPLFKAVGFVVVQWGQAEQSLDLAVNTLYQDYANYNLAKRMPKMLEVKLQFIRNCINTVSELKPVKQNAESLLDDFERLSGIRHNLIHGAISTTTNTNGAYSYLKLHTNKDSHKLEEFSLDLNDFSLLAADLVKLGADSVQFAKQVWELKSR